MAMGTMAGAWSLERGKPQALFVTWLAGRVGAVTATPRVSAPDTPAQAQSG